MAELFCGLTWATHASYPIDNQLLYNQYYKYNGENHMECV